jgi:hypothetical protein
MFKRTLLSSFALSLAALVLPQVSSAAVVINEVMANNVAAVGREGSYPDWLELYNTGTTVVSLAGMTLTDNLSQPTKFAFPADAQLPPNGYLLVWCDGNIVPGEYHAAFSFSASGEEVGLYGANGVLLDSVKFGLQAADFSIGRVPSGTGAWALTSPSPGDANAAQTLGNQSKLRINEWMASTTSGSDWLELYNSELQPSALGGCVFSDKTASPTVNLAIPALSFIGPESFLQYMASGETNHGHVNFKLGAGGETISLFAPNRTTVLSRVKFGQQTADVSEGKLPDGTDNVVAFGFGKTTPGASNFQPLDGVVINEVLTHTDFPFEDAVELQNLSTDPIAIGGWWLSNSRTDAKKFRIPANVVIAPGGFRVLYEVQFDPDDTGNDPSFRFNSSKGDECHLFNADAAGNLLGNIASVRLSPAENGVSLGRVVTSEGVDFVPMASTTFGQDSPATVPLFRTGAGKTNSAPKIGPMVITEIMYHPQSASASADDVFGEYVEVRNITSAALPLYNALNTLTVTSNSWKLEGQVRFQFPIRTTLAAKAYALVVGFNPTNRSDLNAFRALYQVSTNVPIFGPYRGRLSNGGGSLELLKPDEVQRPPHPDAGYIPFIPVDRVVYRDAAPWPLEADGLGKSLHRRSQEGYANEPLNWFAADPTPGVGAPPPVPLTISGIEVVGTQVSITFTALAGRTFQLEYTESLETPSWKALSVSIPVQATDGPMTVKDAVVPGKAGRYYRLVSPLN